MCVRIVCTAICRTLLEIRPNYFCLISLSRKSSFVGKKSLQDTQRAKPLLITLDAGFAINSQICVRIREIEMRYVLL